MGCGREGQTHRGCGDVLAVCRCHQAECAINTRASEHASAKAKGRKEGRERQGESESVCVCVSVWAVAHVRVHTSIDTAYR